MLIYQLAVTISSILVQLHFLSYSQQIIYDFKLQIEATLPISLHHLHLSFTFTPFMAAILQNSEEAGPFLLHDFSMCLWLIPSQLLGNFLPAVFWHTQKNHPLIPIPIFHLQLTKGHFHLTEFSLGNLSNLPVLRLPQPVTPVTLSNCNSRAVLQHFTPILEMFSSSF